MAPAVSDIDAILQRLERQSAANEPPDSARAALGKRLAESWLQINGQQEGNTIFATLIQKKINPSAVSAFCGVLEHTKHIKLSWISQWIALSEQACQDHYGSYDCLFALIRLFARQCVSNDLDLFPELYFKLKLSLTRTSLIREMTGVAFCNSLVKPMLSPLMACLLSHQSSLEERMLFMQGIFRECYKNSEPSVDVIDWLARGLDVHLLGLQGTDEIQMTMEISFQWLLSLSDLMTRRNSQDWGPQIGLIINKILPHFFLSDCRFSLEQVWPNLSIAASNNDTIVSEDCILQLAVFCLSTTVGVLGILKLMEVLASKCKGSKWISKLMLTLACIFNQEEANNDIIRTIHKRYSTLETSGDVTDVLQYFGSHTGDAENLIKYTIDSITNLDATKIPVLDQNALFLLSCVLINDEDSCKLTSSMTTTLFNKFPHLGISMLPTLLQSIQQSTTGTALQSRVKFLCESIVHDPHCAQEVWNLVGIFFTERHSPTEVRTMAIRSFPHLVASNRRLYRRVIDSVGSMIEERNPDIRLAIAATIHDLAAADLIRDVSDVIGWVQTFLTDESPAVVHLSILTLHQLIFNGELDFDVVFKVLNKRLCPVGDVNRVLELDFLAIEALVTLLGDGEQCADDGSDNEAKGEWEVSAQVKSAVNTLIGLAFSGRLSSSNSEESESIGRIRLGILKSLANYSLAALGVDNDGVRAGTTPLEEGVDSIPETGKRYSCLKDLVLQEMMLVDGRSTDHPAIVIASKIVLLEEDELGASIWQRRSKSYSSIKSQASVKSKFKQEDIVSVLPDPRSVREIYDKNPSTAASIACLLAFDGKDRGSLLDFAGDLGNEKLSPVRQLLSMQGWLQAMSRVWLSISTSAEISDIKGVIDEIRAWRNLLDEADFSYVALSCLSLYLPETLLSVNGSELSLAAIVVDIHDSVEQAFKGHEFQSKDNAYLSLACCAVRALEGGSVDQFKRIFDELVQASLSGEETFGMLYGLSMLAQSLASSISSGGSDAFFNSKEREMAMYKAIGLLIDCANSMEPKSDVRIAFAACVRSGKATTDLVQSLSELPLSEAGSQQVKFDILMSTFALCGPSLAKVNPDLGWALLHFVKGFNTGITHVFALSSIFESCKAMQSKENIDCFISEARKLYQQHSNAFLLGSLLATAESAELASLQRAMVDMFDGLTEVEPNMLLGLIPLMTTLPVISLGGHSFTASAQHKNILDMGSVSHLVGKVSFIACNRGDSGVGSMATILYGLLASLTLPPINVQASLRVSSGLQHISSLAIDISRLPVPLERTLLSGLLSCLREHLTASGSQSCVLRCLQPLSLPSQFVGSLLDPIIMDPTYVESDLKAAAIDLLVSQISGRRRAAFDGREFVGLASRTAAMEATTVHSLLGSAASSLLSSINVVVQKASPESISGILTASLHCCLLEPPNVVADWLAAIHIVLQNSGPRSMSPKSLNEVRRFLVNDVFAGLCTLNAEAFSIVASAFDNCVRLLPLEILDQEKFFTFKEDDGHLTTSRKVTCAMNLIRSGFFESTDRRQSVILAAISWFVRTDVNTASISALRRSGMSIAIATSVIDDSARNQVLMLILDAALVQKASSIKIELIGGLASKWNHQTGNVSGLSALLFTGADRVPKLNDKTIEMVGVILVQTMPADVGQVASGSGPASILSNRLNRILGVWTESEPKGILVNCLQRAISCLSRPGSRGGLESTFVTLALLNQ